MSYRALELECLCGEPSSRIDEIGFTAAHELVVHWWCPRCQRAVSMVKALTDCWNQCPRPDSQQPSERPKDYAAEDRQFLLRMGVRLE